MPNKCRSEMLRHPCALTLGDEPLAGAMENGAMQLWVTPAQVVTHPVVEHTTEYFDVIEQEPHPDNPVELQQDHYSGPPSQRHVSELELFRRFKGKPLWEDSVPDWTAVY